MNSSIINDNVCSLICKKCHPGNYHSDVKYHATLKTIVSVVERVLCHLIVMHTWLNPIGQGQTLAHFRDHFKTNTCLQCFELEERATNTIESQHILSNLPNITPEATKVHMILKRSTTLPWSMKMEN